jgi:hypothetical protein
LSKITDFYKKAEADEALRSELEAANKRFEGRETITRDAVVAEVIKIAAQHGTSLEAVDFASEAGELDEVELEAVAGGNVSVCIIPGHDSPGGRKNGRGWTNDPGRPSCTAYGNNPHPVFGVSIKIN